MLFLCGDDLGSEVETVGVGVEIEDGGVVDTLVKSGENEREGSWVLKEGRELEMRWANGLIRLLTGRSSTSKATPACASTKARKAK